MQNIDLFTLSASWRTFVSYFCFMVPVLHYSVVYIFWFFVIIEPIPGSLEILMRVTNEAQLAEPSLSGSENLKLVLFLVLHVCLLL